jgi:hypothetical protein
MYTVGGPAIGLIVDQAPGAKGAGFKGKKEYIIYYHKL